eukprot:COSAG02_NODE_1308_length_13334_cov_5.973706_9_plen_87_part_00
MRGAGCGGGAPRAVRRRSLCTLGLPGMGRGAAGGGRRAAIPIPVEYCALINSRRRGALIRDRLTQFGRQYRHTGNRITTVYTIQFI